MLAAWTIFGARDLMAMSAARTLIVGATNAIAVTFFVVIGTIYWVPAMVMLITAMVGGYVAARIVRRAPLGQLRFSIATLNFMITAAFFWRTFF
jgi:uncharacterized membrane protein YfcA